MKIQIEWVNPKQLKPAGFNPPMRVNLKDEKMRALIDAIKRIGFVDPVTTANNYEIIDGHRRTAAAIHLKLSEIPIIRLPLSLQAGWAALNEPTMPIGDKSWVYVLSPTGGFDVANAPKSIQLKYRKIESLIPNGVAMLAERGMTFNVWHVLGTVCKFLGVEPKDKDNRAKILTWLIVNEMQYPARKAIETEAITPTELWRAIRANKPLRRVESYSAAIED